MATQSTIWLRPRWLTAAVGLAIGAVLATTALLTPAPVQAVHGSPYNNFEVDGNPTDPTFPSGTAPNLPDDWDSIFQLPYTGTATQPVYPSPRGTPTAGDRETFVFDDGTNSTVDYGFSGQSNKDIQDVGQWLYDSASVTPDKNNITHAYAKAYRVDVDPSAGTEDHLVIAFGADRFANNGDAALGFWFFQDDVRLGTANRRGVGGFTGEHVDGDTLVQVDFINGGTRANKIQIFKWRSDGLGTHGTLDQVAYAQGTGDAVCIGDDGLFQQFDDDACAQTNGVAWPSPWGYTPKSGAAGIFGIQSFFEGQIDITALLDEEVCFSTFMAETRTTHSETGELKDFALGEFELCDVDLVRKSCRASAGVSPLYLPSTNTFQTEHVVEIQNNGFGPVYDLQIQDNAVTTTNPASTTGSSCRITAITGGINPVNPGAGGIQMPVPVLDNASTADDGWVTIADGLSSTAGSNSISVVMLCISPSNPFVNTASIRAAPLTGLPRTLTDTYTEVDTQVTGGPPSDVRPQCVRSLASGLTLTKACPDPVVLELVGGIYRPKVCVDITLKNDGDSIIDIASFVDDYNDPTLTNRSLLSFVGTDGSLDPGETVSVEDCYNPATPDSTGDPPVVVLDPDRVTFGDKVTASGRPRHSPGTLVTATEKTASCPLCPIGLNN